LPEEGTEHRTARRRRREEKGNEKKDNEKNLFLKAITSLEIKM